MFATTHTSHASTEIIKWLVLFVIGGALVALLLARPASGTEIPRDEVAPPMHSAWAWAVDDFRRGDLDQAAKTMSTLDWLRDQLPLAENTETQVGVVVWHAIALQAQGEMDSAIQVWRGVNLPREAAVWKQVALASAYMATGRESQAADSLAEAARLAPEQPVVSYYLGLWNLEQASRAVERMPGPYRLAVYTTPLPAPRSMYLLAATAQLEQAVARADTFDWSEPLAELDPMLDPWLAPTAYDLLRAAPAEQFAGQAHLFLGETYTDQGCFEVAETHLDQAAEAQLRVGDSYANLAGELNRAGDHSGALRLYGKALKAEPARPTRILDALNSLRQSMLDQVER